MFLKYEKEKNKQTNKRTNKENKQQPENLKEAIQTNQTYLVFSTCS
jgi:16S rRNA C967 or C1407 C5-methylase (RsmB/RsmF family)